MIVMLSAMRRQRWHNHSLGFSFHPHHINLVNIRAVVRAQSLHGIQGIMVRVMRAAIVAHAQFGDWVLTLSAIRVVVRARSLHGIQDSMLTAMRAAVRAREVFWV